jgi:hypothetical protein
MKRLNFNDIPFLNLKQPRKLLKCFKNGLDPLVQRSQNVVYIIFYQKGAKATPLTLCLFIDHLKKKKKKNEKI